MNKIVFTAAVLDALPIPSKGRRDMYHDARQGVRSLVLVVTSAGNKTFYVYRWTEGRPVKVRIGPYPDWKIDAARKKAEEINANLTQGRPGKPAAARAEMTVGELWTWYLDTHSRPHKTTWRQDEGRWQGYLSVLAPLPLSEVSRAELRRLHVEWGHKAGASHGGHYAANKAIILLRNMYNLAADHELYAGPNPAKGIKLYPERSRDRRLDGDELRRLVAALAETEDETARDWILMSLYTGARKSNVLAMRWDEIDWRRNEWRIPVTKNGESQTIPLEAVEVAILTRRKAASASEWVFPGRWGRGHLVDGRKPWLAVLEAAGVEDFHVHDLRRTHGSYLADVGASLLLIGTALGHKDSDSTRIYARMDKDPLRAAKRKALAAMGAAQEPRSPRVRRGVTRARVDG